MVNGLLLYVLGQGIELFRLKTWIVMTSLFPLTFYGLLVNLYFYTIRVYWRSEKKSVCIRTDQRTKLTLKSQLGSWKVVSFPSLQLDRWSVQDTQRLVRSRSPTGLKLIGGSGKGRGHCRHMVSKKSLLKGQGWGVWLAHQSPRPLPTFSASFPLYHSC